MLNKIGIWIVLLFGAIIIIALLKTLLFYYKNDANFNFKKHIGDLYYTFNEVDGNNPFKYSLADTLEIYRLEEVRTGKDGYGLYLRLTLVGNKNKLYDKEITIESNEFSQKFKHLDDTIKDQIEDCGIFV